MREGKPEPADQALVHGYQAFAPYYHLWWRLFETKAHRRALQAAALQPDHRVLEVAVGDGHLARRLIDLVPDGWLDGVDLTPAMLRCAARRLARSGRTNYGLQVADARHLPFPASTFDRLFNTYMLELIAPAEIPAILCEFRRVLKPGGRCVLLTYSGGSPAAALCWRLAARRWPLVVGEFRADPLAEMLHEAGFRVESKQEIRERGLASQLLVGTREIT